MSWESLVSFQGSRYSVPPEYAGTTVAVASVGGQIIVRAGDLVIAEHKQAAAAGQCVVEKDHLAELWKITERQVRVPEGSARWRIDFTPTVERMPLSAFEEVLV